MKKLFVFLLIMCSLSAAFAQLRIANDTGKNLRLTVNSQTITTKGKEVAFFDSRDRNVNIEVLDLASGVKYYLTKSVPRSGLVTLGPADLQTLQPVTQTVTTQTTQTTQGTQYTYNTPTTTATTGPSLSSILEGNANAKSATYQSNQSGTPSGVTPLPNTMTSPAQNQIALDKVLVIYDGYDRFKVFSDPTKSWQGIEFRGKETTDSIKDNAKNKYYVYLQKNTDIHLGVIYNISSSICEYGVFRKRLNAEDDTLYINEGEIKKMSTNETKQIRVKFLARGYKIYFEPKPDLRTRSSKNEPISLKFNQKSRPFTVPIGQFYLKVSCTDARGMFHPTLFIPLHVTVSDTYAEITAQDVEKAINADINLNWSNLNYKK